MQTKSALSTSMAALLFLATSAPQAIAADECNNVQMQPVIAESGSSVSGHAILVVNNEGADATIQAENLTPGAAYTVWFVYFDNPANCVVPFHCGPPDLTTPLSNPTGVVGRMDSAVAGANGRLTFRGTLRDFRVSAGSAVHLAIFSHGLADTIDNRERARQLLTPESPGLGAPGLGVGAKKGFLVGHSIFEIGGCK